MLISTKGRYALRVMIDLAEHRSGEFISLKEIAQRQEISEKYLESIIRTLVKAKVVESLRGKGGGYRLTKNPEQYTVGSILRRRWPVWRRLLEPVPGRGNAARWRCGRDWIR